jgi:hypothetical protein
VFSARPTESVLATALGIRQPRAADGALQGV